MASCRHRSCFQRCARRERKRSISSLRGQRVRCMKVRAEVRLRLKSPTPAITGGRRWTIDVFWERPGRAVWVHKQGVFAPLVVACARPRELPREPTTRDTTGRGGTSTGRPELTIAVLRHVKCPRQRHPRRNLSVAQRRVPIAAPAGGAAGALRGRRN